MKVFGLLVASTLVGFSFTANSQIMLDRKDYPASPGGEAQWHCCKIYQTPKGCDAEWFDYGPSQIITRCMFKYLSKKSIHSNIRSSTKGIKSSGLGKIKRKQSRKTTKRRSSVRSPIISDGG